jgi:23S rRNA-/tRNA-specific pseudouridylate synthase
MNILYKKFQPDHFEARYEVHEPQDGMRLDQFLQRHFPSFSREQVKEKIKDGDVTINNRPGRMKPNTKVYNKEQVTVFIYKTIHEDEWWNGEKLELEINPPIIYEDEGLIALSKPPFMSTHPTGKHLFYCATVYCEAHCGHGTHSVHRLDRETSGVLLVAKNPKAANKYTVYFEKEQVNKCYFFIGVKNESYANNEEFTAKERLDTGGEGLLRVLIGHHPEDGPAGKRPFQGQVVSTKSVFTPWPMVSPSSETKYIMVHIRCFKALKTVMQSLKTTPICSSLVTPYTQRPLIFHGREGEEVSFVSLQKI